MISAQTRRACRVKPLHTPHQLRGSLFRIMRWNKIAVNARDCNAAGSITFVTESAPEFRESDFALPHRVLLSPHPNFLRAPGCRPHIRPVGKGVLK
jgi:hypothetical protein